jgi:phage major head subunit gpT-like protein
MTEPTPLTDAVGFRVPSNTRDQRYPFVQSLSGAMRKWDGGERYFNNVVVDGFVVTNAKWENSLAIERTDIEDDQYGVYSSMLIPNLARHAKLLSDQKIADQINAGNSTLCYDGQNFFATGHPVDPSVTGGATQSNSITGAAFSGTALAKAQATMMGFLGPDGLPMGNYGDTILVPPSLKYQADIIANSTFFPEVKNGSSNAVFGSTANPWKGQYNVVCSPWLTDTGDPSTAIWYLLDCRYPNMRPFFWQSREEAQLVSLTDPANTAVFFQDKFYMGARSRGAASNALWFKACRCAP